VISRFLVPALAAAAFAAVPTAATAATTVGQVQMGGGATCATNDELITTQVVSGASYEIPNAGVLTKWSTFGAASDDNDQMALRVYDSESTSAFTPRFDSGMKTIAAGSVNDFPARVSVNAGQWIGVLMGMVNGNDSQCVSAPLGPGNTLALNPSPQPVGTQEAFSPVGNNAVDLSAVIEPDADGDGYGDETQDACPQNPQRHEPPCVAPDTTPPETTIVRRPKAKTTAHQATFGFRSSEPGGSFQCSLDGAGFRTCISPRILRVGKGFHLFRVRAIDASGNVDGSPARAAWRVKAKPKRH
jgi:hypothetical protein